MFTSVKGRTLIEKYEGLILHAYDDANDRIVNPGDHVRGVLTIGYGHTTAAGPPAVIPGMGITKELADKYLANDLGKVEAEVTRLVKVPLNQNQFDALVSFQFNTGALGKASLLTKLNNRDYQGAADGLLAWVHASQIGPGPIKGLVMRRNEERELFLTPMKPNLGPATGAIVVATGTAATVASQSGHHWGYVIAGVVTAALATWFIIHELSNKKVNT